jgi:hypothetical protein
MHLWIYSHIAKIPNMLSSTVVGEQLLYLSSYLVLLVSFAFLSLYLTLTTHGEAILS